LLLLKKEPVHGYELVERIKTVELLKALPDPGVVYRYLRRLEDMGMLESHLEPGSGGPARRVYSITPEGEDYLKAWVASLRDMRDALDSFIMMAEKDLS
jgi:DNA-binding PadR family transcriptional regulator